MEKVKVEMHEVKHVSNKKNEAYEQETIATLCCVAVMVHTSEYMQLIYAIQYG